MTLHHAHLAAGETLQQPDHAHQAVWLKSGFLTAGTRTVLEGEGTYAGESAVVATAQSKLLVFRISPGSMEDGEVFGATFDWDGSAILRLDQVTFPPGARAYRHVHPGPGIRVLTAGEIEIKSDHDCTMMHPGDAWFEDADSPVQATAGDTSTAFVRAMVLPEAYLGKPTLRLLNAEDHEKPRLQTNIRFFDQIINLSDA